ncbi:hypothetical protein F5J12DRAFT_742203 [Pisolithus orientalis]|uniref:uncharacterized protein n=1 Tax=Pisolithus orientalis TaxID=936130 RepID=UPI002224B708|nr:uncharacterized protein F5J12DRAFT_742203 [Pisolithus orientalis]KAI6007710.1 hypothetical protein F5J12DRAFT_742203 [Pisolithus orientalis]
MSAYGAISCVPRTSYLPSTIWPHPAPANPNQRKENANTICIHHIDLQFAIKQEHEGLFEYLHVVFADEVDKGMTYPQEDMRDPATFANYFFAADVIVAIVGARSPDEDTPVGMSTSEVNEAVREVNLSLEASRRGRSWAECVAGFYYVKSNYPGRSSHICNAGFVVPPTQRGRGYGRVLAKSYLHYAPRLGYKASIFNLVYVNNEASIRLWENLGFIKAGRIPKAGRLKRSDGKGEEYVDAWVFYRSFSDLGSEGEAP